MLNQRGQAFSVFELMIAGVVAFAILIVLLMVINGVNPNTAQDVKTVIVNGIKGVSPSGDQTTGVFELKNNGIDSSDLVDKTGLSKESMFFAKGQYGNNTSVVLADDMGGFRYTGTNSFRAQARIICKQTGQNLDEYLSNYLANDAKYQNDSSLGGGVGEQYCQSSEPCCIIILERTTK
jgi:hypothetical protein